MESLRVRDEQSTRFIDPDGRIPIAIPVVVAIAWYLYEAQLNAPAEGAELVDDVTEIDMLGAVMDGEDVASMGAIGLLRRGGKAGLKMLRRFDGPKPKYTVNPAHVPGRGLRAGKTPLPDDADDVYRNAVPNDPDKPTAWFGKNSDGEIYRYSPGNDGTVHFSGSGSELGNLTTYAKQRLESR